jgi:CubicO group peptidase (beta-lactamase class C family)
MKHIEETYASLWQGLDENQAPLLNASNPSFPDFPISTRMLLSHTSSFRDNWEVVLENIKPGDPNDLDTYLSSVFQSDGANYSPDNFNHHAPQQGWNYCNHCNALAGLVTQKKTGVEFDSYCQDAIFGPLNMTDSSFYPMRLDAGRMAICHENEGETGPQVALDTYSIPDFPAGNMRATIGDMTKFLQMIVNNGTLGGVDILQAATMEEIRRLQYPHLNSDQALGFMYSAEGQRLGHSGSMFGAATEMHYQPLDGVGVVVMANGDISSWAAYNAVRSCHGTLYLLLLTLFLAQEKKGCPILIYLFSHPISVAKYFEPAFCGRE